jgi:hypothetical protein
VCTHKQYILFLHVVQAFVSGIWFVYIQTEGSSLCIWISVRIQLCERAPNCPSILLRVRVQDFPFFCHWRQYHHEKPSKELAKIHLKRFFKYIFLKQEERAIKRLFKE